MEWRLEMCTDGRVVMAIYAKMLFVVHFIVGAVGLPEHCPERPGGLSRLPSLLAHTCSIYFNGIVVVEMWFRAFAQGGLQSAVNGQCQFLMGILMATSNCRCEEKAREVVCSLSDRVWAKGTLPVLVSVNGELTCDLPELVKQRPRHVRGHDLSNRPVEILHPKSHREGVGCIHVWVVAVRILLNVKRSFYVVLEDIVPHTNGGEAARYVLCEDLTLPRPGS